MAPKTAPTPDIANVGGVHDIELISRFLIFASMCEASLNPTDLLSVALWLTKACDGIKKTTKEADHGPNSKRNNQGH